MAKLRLVPMDSLMPKALFHLVDQIRAAEKYCDASRDDIRRLLMPKGRCHLPIEVDVMDGSELLTVNLRLNINTKAEVPRSWTMSIKLHDWMIDCVDYEQKYRLQTGGNGSGWHRHQWDADDESAKRGKLPATELEGVTTHDEFLIRGLGVFNVRVNPVGHGEPELQFA